MRRRMVGGAVQLLAQRGLQATSFSEVLALTGAPRGSVYHHFPQGKDQMVGLAVDAAGAYLVESMERHAGASAEAITRAFVDLWRDVLTRSGFSAGCAVLAVAVAADSAELLAHAAQVFRAWRERLGALLEQGGLEAGDATRFATMLIASVEGAVVLARTDKSLVPFEAVAAQLIESARQRPVRR